MTSSARTGILLLMTIAGLAGCGGAGSGVPSAPTAAGPSSSTPVTLVGVGYVMDTAFKPLAGARVDVVDGPQVGASMITDANGRYTLNGTFARTSTLRASADGYVTVTHGFSATSWLLFYLPPPEPPVDLAGDYALTFVADSGCTDLPSELRTRTYAATIVRAASPVSFVLTATGAHFLGGLTGFDIGVAGHSLGLWLHGGHDPSLVEQLTPNTYLAFSGLATASAESSTSSPISAAFDGWIDYCVMPGPMGSGYNCGTSNVTGEPIPGTAVTYAHCQSPNHRLILTRR